ncbi:hypothetical protein [Algoriphagus sp. Y33]|uniref:hypothetical protein n=1 Tax=Algoriphagus sp. Y33 TaxID=2772483 RepID=UPI00178467F9|nr:hypothetical protein [Algoriphagus sp. Y33]
MKNLLILGLFVIVILVFVSIWMQGQSIDRGKKHFEEFNSAVIDTQIKSLRIAYKGTEMRLMDGREFVFYPLTDRDLNEGKKFSYTAVKGDHVFKPAFSDTLFLIHEDKKLAYTFKKMID